MKTAALVSCFNYYDIRLKYVEEYLVAQGFIVHYITSDYDHILKSYFKLTRSQAHQVHAKKYKKNLSLQRMVSHYFWSKNAMMKVREIKPQVLFVMIPPNSLLKYAAQYCRESGCKLAIDIYDLWPETYPYLTKAVFKVPFLLWRGLRDRYLKVSDVVTTECRLFQNVISEQLLGLNVVTLYPVMSEKTSPNLVELKENEIHIAYLGSINHIVDIELITELIQGLQQQKRLQIHIIGAGENKELFIKKISAPNVTVNDYGAIFSHEAKREVLCKCHYGLNVMKKTVCIGLSMKSIDYLREGIPILNTVAGDTRELVSNYNIGFNIDNLEEAIELVLSTSSDCNYRMRKNARNVFLRYFSPLAFKERMNEVLAFLESEND